jgi:hypothetical protein
MDKMDRVALSVVDVVASADGVFIDPRKRIRRGARAAPVVRIQRPREPKAPSTGADLLAITLAVVKRQCRAAKRHREVLAGGWGEAARQAALSATA